MSVDTVPVKIQWLIAINRLLTKYFRSCLRCGDGRCPSCREFEHWQPKLASLIKPERVPLEPEGGEE